MPLPRTIAGAPAADPDSAAVAAGGALLAIDQGFMGPNYSISTACATANYAFVSGAPTLHLGARIRHVWRQLQLQQCNCFLATSAGISPTWALQAAGQMNCKLHHLQSAPHRLPSCPALQLPTTSATAMLT